MAVDDRRRTDPRALQVSAWRGDERIAVLSPAPEQPTPSAEVVAAAVGRLRDLGTERVLTGALHRSELAPFLASGFTPHERLHLLRHDLLQLPRAGRPLRIRRARRADQPTVLDIDARAFDEFWTLDRGGLHDAVRATPVSRFRVATSGRGGPVLGYAVTGRAADRGYLQRLAVDPDHHREGVGSALVVDALRWLRRHGARVAVVNTQEGNGGALGLYESCGFVAEPAGLTVLTLDLPAGP
ncbi:MAG: acetyltransferase [Marmoricola sp.]|nr:acetyltransferase [Marmoricola sp.]